IPLLYVSVILLLFLGFSVPITSMSVILSIGLGLALLQQYLIRKKWLIDPSYRYLFTVFFWILITVGIRQTGCILSPFIWVGLFAIINESIYYNFRRGMLLAGAYILFFWITFPLDLMGILPHPVWIPGFYPYHFPKFIYSLLAGYTLFYAFIPFAVGLLSDRLRKEKQIAQVAAEEQKKAYRMSLSIMEDLEETKEELVAKVKDIEDSRRATLHLLQDVEQGAEEMRKLYEDLKVVDRMKTELLSVVSHELKTPLTPILGYISMFLTESHGKLDPTYKKGAEVIRKQAKHLLGLIESLLDVARLERGMGLELKKEPVSIKAIMDELMEVFQPQFDAQKIKCEIKVPEDFPTLIVDSVKIRNLFTNLLGNVLKFVPSGGRVKIVGIVEENTVQLQVMDDGIGISKENLEKVFEKFYQVDSSYTRAVGGTGLGLSIAKEIAEAHGGKVWVESEGLGKGSKFCIRLPIGGE
ncbi:MAG: HAMP domain-containing sensor histidine kinase, partial [Candidatus Margulisiibacteriota bacterium]